MKEKKMSQQLTVMIEGKQGAGKTQIGQAMLKALDKMDKSAQLSDEGLTQFNRKGIADKNRGHKPEVIIKTRQK